MINPSHPRTLSVTLALAAFSACSSVPMAAEGGSKPPVRSAGGRKAVEITIYNSDMALVREERSMNLAKGNNRVQVPEVPATIDPTSVHFASLTDPASVRVLEQNYQYDLVNRAKLLEKYVGRTVDFVRLDAEGKKEYTVQGKLLAIGDDAGGGGGAGAPNAGLIAEVGGKVEVDPVGRLVLPSLPEGLILKPQLEWQLSSTRDGEQKTEISYIARGLSWDCDYVAVLDKDDAKLDIKGWVTLNNRSGTTFKDAGLKLVAGDVNQVQDNGNMAYAMAAERASAKAEPQFTQKNLFEYKLYALQRRTDLLDRESKQIELLSGKGVPVKKQLIYDGYETGWRWYLNNTGYRNQGSMGQESNPKVGVYLVLKNDAKSGLGIPMPKGRFRVYKKDEDGKEQFIGEDRRDHTPKDEEVRLYLGNAFDVTGSRTQINFRTLSSGKVVEETFQIKVGNHKDEAVDVAVYEHPWRWSQWEITASSTPWEKVDQTTLKFPIKIAKDKDQVLTYTIRYTW